MQTHTNTHDFVMFAMQFTTFFIPIATSTPECSKCCKRSTGSSLTWGTKRMLWPSWHRMRIHRCQSPKRPSHINHAIRRMRLHIRPGNLPRRKFGAQLQQRLYPRRKCRGGVAATDHGASTAIAWPWCVPFQAHRCDTRSQSDSVVCVYCKPIPVTQGSLFQPTQCIQPSKMGKKLNNAK